MRKTTKKKESQAHGYRYQYQCKSTHSHALQLDFEKCWQSAKKKRGSARDFRQHFFLYCGLYCFCHFFFFSARFFFFWVRALISPNFGYALFCDCEFLCLFSHFLVIVRVSSLTFVRSVRASLFFFGDLRPTKCCCLAVCNFCACRWSLSGRKKKIVRGSLNPLIWGLWGVGKFNRLANFFYGSPSLYSALSLRFRHRNRQLLIMDRIWLKGW